MKKAKSIVEAIRSKKSMKDQEVDLQENGDVSLDHFDELDEKAAKKGAYYDLDQISDQPMDSNLQGDDLSDEDKHGAGMIAEIMRKMRSKRS